jgi:hypothetical protein
VRTWNITRVEIYMPLGLYFQKEYLFFCFFVFLFVFNGPTTWVFSFTSAVVR